MSPALIAGGRLFGRHSCQLDRLPGTPTHNSSHVAGIAPRKLCILSVAAQVRPLQSAERGLSGGCSPPSKRQRGGGVLLECHVENLRHIARILRLIGAFTAGCHCSALIASAAPTEDRGRRSGYKSGLGSTSRLIPGRPCLDSLKDSPGQALTALGLGPGRDSGVPRLQTRRPAGKPAGPVEGGAAAGAWRAG
jgi:hypothetical protein